jgi:hypothetical protein
MMKAHGLALVTVLLALPAMAQPAPLPFALDRIRFGMTLAEAEPILLGLVPKIPNTPTGTSSDPAYFVGPYHWQDCSFDVGFYFEGRFGFPRGHLSGVALFFPTNTPDKCLREAFDELTAHFGVENAAAKDFDRSLSSYDAWEQPAPRSEDRSWAALRRLKVPLPIRYFEDLDDAITGTTVLSSGAGSILIEELPGGDIAALPAKIEDPQARNP